MNNYEELLTASYMILQSMNKKNGETPEENYDVKNVIIEEINKSSPEQREQWIHHLLATIEHLFDVNPQVTNHELFTNNPLTSAQSYITFEKEQESKSLQ
jgi:hypothetical protein